MPGRLRSSDRWKPSQESPFRPGAGLLCAARAVQGCAIYAAPCPGPNSGIKKGGGYSYPSSHAAISRVFAAVLADIAPERKAEFFAKADEIARDRVIIGVHYPADIAAGKDLGDLFHSELLKSETYLQDLKRVKTLLLK